MIMKLKLRVGDSTHKVTYNIADCEHALRCHTKENWFHIYLNSQGDIELYFTDPIEVRDGEVIKDEQ